MSASPAAPAAPNRPETAIREDAVLDGRVRLRQPVAGYRVAVDPVLLAAAVPARAGEHVLDLGTGVGGAALCLLARVPGVRAVGLDLQADLVRLAAGNAVLNDAAFRPVAGDIAQPPFPADSVDHVMANPPYLRPETARRSPDAARDRANVEGAAGLDTWIATALRLVRPGGSVTFIHRADRLDALLAFLHGRAGAIEVCPIWPRAGTPTEPGDAKRVVVRARAGRRTPLRLAPGLALHDPGGGDSAAARAVLREARSLADVHAL